MTRVKPGATIALTVVLLALSVLGLALDVTARSAGDLNPVSEFIYLSNPLVLAAVGGVLAVRRPNHWAGWTLLIMAVAFVADSLSKGVFAHYEAHQHWTDGLAPWGVWLDDWVWTVILAGLLYTVLKFAGGTSYGRRLRAVGWAGMGMFAVLLLTSMAASGNDSYKRIPPAIHTSLSGTQASAVIFPVFLLAIVAIACATAALIIHSRHAAGAERARLRWLLWSFGSTIGLLITGQLLTGVLALLHTPGTLLYNGMDVIEQLSLFMIPIAIYVSVTRHGLFEIDRVISRTVTYSLLTAGFGIGYVVVVTSASRLVPDRFGSLPVAAATLAVVMLIVPVRRRVIALIDRRFNRSRYSAERVVEAFAEQVRRDGAEDPDGRDLVAAVSAALEPAHASVWLVPTA